MTKQEAQELQELFASVNKDRERLQEFVDLLIWTDTKDGVAHVSHKPFGIGSYVYRDQEMCALRDEIKTALGGQGVGK